MTIDALKEKWDGIYAWNVKDGRVEPPKHTFPKALKTVQIILLKCSKTE